jgi:hypothetical protein
MSKRKLVTNITSRDPSLPSPKRLKTPNPTRTKKPKAPAVTLDSDPTIRTDHDKISALLAQKKTWRHAPRTKNFINGREIGNYFPDHNTDSIKKRFQLCRKVLMESFSPDDVPPLHGPSD